MLSASAAMVFRGLIEYVYIQEMSSDFAQKWINISEHVILHFIWHVQRRNAARFLNIS